MSSIPLSTYFPNISQLAYGCMGLGGEWMANSITKQDIALANSVIDCALEAGVNFIDHADIYSRGKAEQVFGEVLKTRPELTQHMFIQSKCGIRFEDEYGPKRFDFSKEWIMESAEGCLNRLNIECLDIFLLHRPDSLMEIEEVAEAFRLLKQAGKVKYFGVSNMHHHQMAWLQSALDEPLVANQLELGLHKLDWLDGQVNFNVGSDKPANFESGTLEYCQLNNVQLQAWSCLGRGIYSGADVSHASLAIQKTASVVSQLAADYGVSKEAIVLGFLTRHPAGIQPVIGTTNLSRIKACTEVGNLTLSRGHWYQLYEAARGVELP